MRSVARAGVAIVLAVVAATVVPAGASAQDIFYVKADDIPVVETFAGPAGLGLNQTTGSLYAGLPLGPNFLPPGPPTGDGVERFDASGASQGTFASGLAATGVAVGAPGAADEGNVYVFDAGLFDGTPDINTFDPTGAPVGSPIPVDLSAYNPATVPQIAAFNPGVPFLAYPNADDDVVDLFSGGAPVGTANGVGPTALVDPTAVAVAPDLTFYVVDAADGGRVVKLRPFVFGDEGEVMAGTTGATSVAVDPATGNVYVGQGSGATFHVVVYDSSGAQIGAFGEGDFEDGNNFPRSIAVESSTKKVYVSDSPAGNTKRIVVYEEGAPPPTVTTMSSSRVSQTTATLAGTVAQSSIGPVTNCRFEYTDDADFQANGFANAGQAACTSEYPNGGASLVLATANVSGLNPDTTYRFRLVATNSGGTGEGGDVVFETLPNPPTVVTGAAADVNQTRATLGGTVNPNGGPVTTCEIELGTTTAYGQSRQCASSPGGGTSAVGVHANVAGLSPGTTYHFRVRAANGGGASDGTDQTFRTADRPDPCLVDVESCKPTDQCVVTPAVCKPPTAVKATVPGAIAVRAGRALIRLSCKGTAGATCKGRLRLRARIDPAGPRKARTVTIGTARYEVTAGTSRVLRVRLSRAARRSLASKGRLRGRITGAGVTDRGVLFRLRPVD